MFSKLEDITLEGLKSKCTLIHYFGLGFIQIKLGEACRLHVYTSELPAIVSPESVHNHRYSFGSTILAGTLCQAIYDVRGVDVEELATHVLEDDACTEGVASGRVPEKCCVMLLSTQTFTAGSRYYLHKDTYHTVYTTTGTITLLNRFEKTKEYAQVVRPIDSPHVCPFSKKIPEEELWDRVEEALKSHNSEMLTSS